MRNSCGVSLPSEPQTQWGHTICICTHLAHTTTALVDQDDLAVKTKEFFALTITEIAELAVFLYGLASTALSQVSEQKPKNRVRQMQWIKQMVKALIKNFETKS